MVMTNFLQERRSVRDFKPDALKPDDVEFVKKSMKEVEEEDKLDLIGFEFYQNGSIIYEGLKGKAGYKGVMINAPQYVAIICKDDSQKALIDIGFNLERLNTKLVEHDLGTCWVTVDRVHENTKKNVFGKEGKDINYIVGIGYPAEKKYFSKEVVTPRKPMDEIVFKDDFNTVPTMDELENLGLLELFSSIRFAPSHMNSQPWRFLLKEDSIYAYMIVSDWDSRSLVDMGVVMFYLREMAKHLGLERDWELLDGEEEDGMRLVGRFLL